MKFNLNKLKYKWFILGVTIGLLTNYTIEFFIISRTNIFYTPLGIPRFFWDSMIFLPIIMGVMGYLFDKKSLRINKLTQFYKLKWLYLCLFFGAFFPLIIAIADGLTKAQFISHFFLYLPNKIVGAGYGEIYTSSLLIGSFFIIIIYPLIFALIGLIIDLIKLKKNK